MSAVFNMRESAGMAVSRIREGRACSLRDARARHKFPRCSDAQAQLLYNSSRGIGAAEVRAIPRFGSPGMGLREWLWFLASPRYGGSGSQVPSSRTEASRKGEAGKVLQQPPYARSEAPWSGVAHKALQ